MDVRASSSARSPLPLTHILKIEKDADSMYSEEESNPLEQEDEYVAQESEEDSKLMEALKEFIMTLESLQLLWNPKNRNYTNKYKRHKALAKLVPILRKIKPHATIDDVKKKINTLRSNYRRYLRQAMAHKRTGHDVNKPKIWYYPYLDFLSKLEERTNQEKDFASEEEKSQRRLPQVVTSFSLVTAPESSSIPLSEMRNSIIQSKTIDSPCQSLSKIRQSAETSHPKNISNHLVLEWAETLEKLDHMQRLYAKKAINDILFEAELGNLHKDSVKINDAGSNVPSTSSSVLSSTQYFSPT